MKTIQMVDLKRQYQKIKPAIDEAIQNTIDQTSFINGQAVNNFSQALSSYLNGAHVHTCGNGTDALQIALMALNLNAGDEIITPAFTYFATVEVVLLLGLKPVFVDVNPDTFNIDIDKIEAAIGPKTKAIVPVHLFGQSADMEAIMSIAQTHHIKVIEDNAQSIGGNIQFSDGQSHLCGTIGDIACTSFFPSKNLGCYGDGGALSCKDTQLSAQIKAIANHGQSKKYYHDIVGVNSRLDTLQAAILNIKLPYLDSYNNARRQVAEAYNNAFKHNELLDIPYVSPNVYHVYHQYTLKLSRKINREQLRQALAEKGIPTMVYYPVPCHLQKAYSDLYTTEAHFPVAEYLSQHVLSLPIHTEMDAAQIEYITEQVNTISSALAK